MDRPNLFDCDQRKKNHKVTGSQNNHLIDPKK